MKNYVITKQTNEGTQIGLQTYTEAEAIKRVTEMKAAGHKNVSYELEHDALNGNCN